jgi:Ca-activated chloride channel family protein
VRRIFLWISALAPATVLLAQAPAIFRADARLVEVYATVRDNHGRYLDGLEKDRFQVLDNGVPQPLVAFESDSKRLSCAILIDTTGSMAAVLPTVKNSVVHLVDELREGDAAAVYSFSTSLNRLQDFTTDKAAAKQAIFRTRAGGSTALFDAISELAHEIAPRNGKKAIIVFTDGADNASLLNARAAIQRAKKAGVPVYAIAEGEALTSKPLLDELKDVAEMTGGQPYRVHKSSEISTIFQEISGDLQHTYMLVYKPPAVTEAKWRTIQLTVNGLKDPKIRAKEGYLPE